MELPVYTAVNCAMEVCIKDGGHFLKGRVGMKNPLNKLYVTYSFQTTNEVQLVRNIVARPLVGAKNVTHGVYSESPAQLTQV